MDVSKHAVATVEIRKMILLVSTDFRCFVF